jgi:two-component system KDP operon response regulator KdpE
LVVDDHADTLDILRRALERQGHSVLVAGNCADALATAQGAVVDQRGIDLIIGDIGLPDGDGVELMCRLKLLLHCPAVALTGRGTAADRRRCADAGIDGFLLKPVGLRELDEAIRQQVRC